MFKQNKDIMKSLLIAFLIFNLVGCGGSDGQGGEFLSSERLNIVLVSSSGSSETINSSNRTDLTITGLNNTIDIETDLRELVISGSNNLLNFSDNIAVQSCTVSGDDNSALMAGSVNMSCNITGSGNTGF